jgi:hypothetical protein
MEVNRPPSVGSKESLVLLKGQEVVTIDARVLRVTRGTENRDATGESWLVAVEFMTAAPEARLAIPRLLHPSSPERTDPSPKQRRRH